METLESHDFSTTYLIDPTKIRFSLPTIFLIRVPLPDIALLKNRMYTKCFDLPDENKPLFLNCICV